MRYPLALAATLVVETPIYVLALRVAGLSVVRAAAMAIAVNTVTHPVVWLVLEHAGRHYWPAFVVAEVGAWLVETGVLWAVLRRDGRLVAGAALVANCGSCLAGLLLSFPSI